MSEQIEELPEEWEVVKAIDYCDFERGTEPGSDSYNRQGDGVPFIRVGNISAGIQELLFTKSNKIKFCSENDILMSFDGSPGVVVTGYKGAYSSGIRKVTPKTQKLDKTFLFYVLKTKFVQDTIDKYTTGVTIKHASKSLLHIKIPLPPLPEQKKIAAVLSTVQEAKEKTEAVINAAKDLKRSMMKHLFTYGPVPIDEVDSVELKETEIGLLPSDWDVKPLEDLGKMKDGDWILNKHYSKEGVRLLQVGDIGIGNFIGKSSRFISKERAEELGCTLLSPGDILISRMAHPVGRACILPDLDTDCITAVDVAIFRIDEEVYDKKFILFSLNYSKTLEQVEKLATGVTRKRTSRKNIQKVLIPIPPLSEQKKITAILSAIDQKIEAEESVKKALEDLFKTLLHDLMTAKIRVNNLDLNLDLELNPNLNPSLDLNPNPNANSEVKQ